MSPERLGTGKWVAIGASVAALDLLVPGETLSSAFKRAHEHENPLVRAAAIGGLAVTAAHLLRVLPPAVDPYNLIERRCRGRQIN